MSDEDVRASVSGMTGARGACSGFRHVRHVASDTPQCSSSTPFVHTHNAQAEMASRATPKYMNTLMKASQSRERENDRRYERKMAKEVAAEDEEFGDKEKFITASYKRKLEERKLEEEEEKVRDEREASEAVEQRGMGAFFMNQDKNVSMGGASSTVTEEQVDTKKAAAVASEEVVREKRVRYDSDDESDDEETKAAKAKVEKERLAVVERDERAVRRQERIEKIAAARERFFARSGIAVQ